MVLRMTFRIFDFVCCLKFIDFAVVLTIIILLKVNIDMKNMYLLIAKVILIVTDNGV